MRYRRFGNTELMVSEIGFGSWAIGGDAMVGDTAIGWGKANDAESKAAIEAALEEGINFFDTADIYGLGHSEKLLGDTLRNKDVIIATKVGNVAKDGVFTTDYSKEYILNACRESLIRLGREYIDFYQLHSARIKDLEQGECIEAMQQLHSEGKIRYWGISLNTFYPDDEAQFFMDHRLGNGFQLVLNIINQRALRIMKRASENGYGIIARMPLQFGLLTGKFGLNASFDKSDHRHKRLTEEVIAETTRLMQPVWKLCDKYGVSKTELALSYILSYPQVSTIIPGMRTIAQVRENTKGLVELDSADLAEIETSGITSFASLMAIIEKYG